MFTEKDFIYKENLFDLIDSGTFTWKVPSNIALVKYWGKRQPQLPENPSISFTLSESFTKTSVTFNKLKQPNKSISYDFYFEGKKKDSFKPKIDAFFKRVSPYLSFIHSYSMIICSENSFPHSSGIASSASGMAALSLCLMAMEEALNTDISHRYFHQKASFLARLGSGSASRSIEGPLVVWGKHDSIKDSSDLFGVKFSQPVHNNFKNYQDSILLVDKGEKQVSSTVGHNLMNNHPFAQKRFVQANENMVKISEALTTGDLKAFISIVESEALTLHAMMMTSHPYFILMKPNTLEIINKIWEFRNKTNSNVCFTLDAGANVHVLFPEKEKEIVNKFITTQLLQFCQKNHYISDSVGLGAKQIHH